MSDAVKSLSGIAKEHIGTILLVIQKQNETNPAVKKLLNGISISDIMDIYKLLNSGNVQEIQITIK